MTLPSNRADPPVHIEHGLLVTRESVWAFGRLPTFTAELGSEAELLEQSRDMAALINRLREGEYHLLRVTYPYSPEEWARARLTADREASPEWAGYVHGVRSALSERRPRQHQVYLGKQLRIRRTRSIWDWYRTGERHLGLESQLADTELDEWRRARDEFVRLLISFRPEARLASCAELRWLAWRGPWRGLKAPVDAALEDVPAGPEDGLALADGVVANGWRHLRFGEDGESWVTTLCYRHLPPQLGLGWLSPAVDFPHELSMRVQLEPSLEADRRIERSMARAHDMARHMQEAGVEPSRELQETVAAGDEIRHGLKRDQGCLAILAPRIVVWGTSPDELEERVSAIVNHHRGVGVHLARPAGDQLALFFESLPGDRQRVGFRHSVPPVTLGGGLLHASSDLGDGLGPYLGVALGWSEGGSERVAGHPPVFQDPWQAPKVNRPPAILITGDAGGGKTNTGMKIVVESRLRRATSVMVDPKGDADGLARIGGLGRVQRLRLDAEYAGLLDPYRTQIDRNQAAMLAADLLLRFLPPGFLGAGGEVPALVQSAAHQEAQDRDPSMRGVIEGIRSYRDHPSASLVADNLEAVAEMPLARLCFGQGGETVDLLGALTLVQFAGLRLPEPGMDPQQYSLQDRLALGLMTAVMGLLAPLIELGDASHPKLLVVDEAWMLMASEVARGLIDRYVRLGRSKNTVLMLITQNARDVLHQEVVNNVGQHLHFRRQDDRDIEAVCELMGIADTPQVRAYLKQASSGECLYKDLHGRSGRLQVDLVFPGLRRALDTRPDAQAGRARQPGEAA